MSEREILFRGQTRRKGEKVRISGEPVDSNWVYGGIFPGEGDFSIIYQTKPKIEKFTVYSDTVGQFTGLTDKNGLTKIFEYDIIDANGRKVGNYYENSNLLKDGTCFLVAKMGTKEWSRSEQEAIKRGCKYAE